MTPPGRPLVAGHSLFKARRGVVSTGQFVVAVATTPTPLQVFVPRAVKVSVMEQTLVGTIRLPEKSRHSPFVRTGKLATTLPPVLRTLSSTTVTLVSGTLPVLQTVPLKVSTPPGSPLVAGRSLGTGIAGAVHTVQTALFVAQTCLEVGEVSVPHATTVSGNGPHKLPIGVKDPV